MSKTLSRLPYGNYKVLNRDGELMFRCDDRKANWYLKRNLAKIVSNNTVQLLFETKGCGHVGDEFFLQEKLNCCCVCGSHDHLTKHHVVPKGYRKFFPEELKSHSSYDVVTMDIDCHELYEEHAANLKKIIAKEFGIPVHGKGKTRDEKLCRVRAAAYALINHGHKMPHERAEALRDRLREHYGHYDIAQEELEKSADLSCLSDSDYVPHGKYVVEHVGDLEAFVKRWRDHFVLTMKPKFLPDGWSADRSIYKNNMNGQKK